MSNPLTSYLNKRLNEDKFSQKEEWGSAGPVITISREVGCNGLKLARELSDKLNSIRHGGKWRVLSKEIFQQSAQELDMEPEKVKKIFKQIDKYTFEEILNAFKNKQYKSERRIVKTVVDVVRSFAIHGHSIIVGRAAHIIAHDLDRALHIRLTAPLEYRIDNIMKNNNMNREEAIQFINRLENERIAFRKAIKKDRLHDELFDITLNRSSFTTEQIIEILKVCMEHKGILRNVKRSIHIY